MTHLNQLVPRLIAGLFDQQCAGQTRQTSMPMPSVPALVSPLPWPLTASTLGPRVPQFEKFLKPIQTRRGGPSVTGVKPSQGKRTLTSAPPSNTSEKIVK